MASRGTAAEGILLKMLTAADIVAVHGSPSAPGDIIVLPNAIIEVKDPKAGSFSFRDHEAKGEAQWKTLKAKKQKHPWMEIFYVVRFRRKEWRWYPMPDTPAPLRENQGLEMESLLEHLKHVQAEFQKSKVMRERP